ALLARDAGGTLLAPDGALLARDAGGTLLAPDGALLARDAGALLVRDAGGTLLVRTGGGSLLVRITGECKGGAPERTAASGAGGRGGSDASYSARRSLWTSVSYAAVRRVKMRSSGTLAFPSFLPKYRSGWNIAASAKYARLIVFLSASRAAPRSA